MENVNGRERKREVKSRRAIDIVWRERERQRTKREKVKGGLNKGKKEEEGKVGTNREKPQRNKTRKEKYR